MANLSTKNNDIIDLDISVTRKKRFRFDKDDSRLVDINIADMGAIKRLTETYPKFEEWLNEVKYISEVEDDTDSDTLNSLNKISETLTDIDKKMRDALDYIFDAPVSAVAAPDGTMYDMFDGQFRFEYILSLLLSHYENNMEVEFEKMKKQLEKHTKKYTKK